MDVANNSITHFILRNAAQRFGLLSRFTYRFADRFCRYYRNYDFDIATNGELEIIRRLARDQSVKTVFDIGLNHGDWTGMFPEASTRHIHGFEIMPAIFEIARKRLAGRKDVTLNLFGLSDVAGTVSLQYTPTEDGSTSMVLDSALSEKIYPYKFKQAIGEVIRGDSYCATAGIDYIDFIKIDVEGAEMMVLRGFEALFARNAIGALQFECGLPSIASRILQKDFWHFFEERGYVVGKLMPRGAVFAPYDPWQEDFRGPNFIAAHKSRPDLVKLLAVTN